MDELKEHGACPATTDGRLKIAAQQIVIRLLFQANGIAMDNIGSAGVEKSDSRQ